jgi:hypothetical protein
MFSTLMSSYTNGAPAIHDWLVLVGQSFAPFILAIILLWFIGGSLYAFKFPGSPVQYEAEKAISPEVQGILNREAARTESPEYKVGPVWTHKYILFGPKNPSRMVKDKILSLDDANYGGPVRLFGFKLFI